MAALSSEDVLRLNVLLANEIEAIRIDERNMVVYGLTGAQEAAVPLRANCRPDLYLRRVRELLSSHVLGSPGGYPVFLQRWTRMGQAKDAQLAKLLLLGEPEAVVAVTGAAGLTDDLARRAWWTQPTADNARRMLASGAVVQGTMGRKLASFLVEHLPFETDPLTIVTTVKLVLQPGLIDTDTRARIWSRGTHRNVYHIGFLEATPHDLPAPLPARGDFDLYRAKLTTLSREGNAIAALLARVLDCPGQTYVTVAEQALRHPVNQDIAATLLNTIGEYFRVARCEERARADIGGIIAQAEKWERPLPPHLAELVRELPALKREISALCVLAHAGEHLIIDILAKTTASGTLLRRKLDPVVEPILAQCAVLRGTATPQPIAHRAR